MKKLFFLVAIVCLVACGGANDKVAETYLKAVVSQQVQNAEESLVVVTPLDVDSLRALIIAEFTMEVEREQRGLDADNSDREYFAKFYGGAEGLAAHQKETNDKIDAIKALIEETKTKDFPQYYLCSYNGEHHELVCTEEAQNADDFCSLTKLTRTIRDDMKEAAK